MKSIALSLWVLGFAAGARADATHYQTLQLGERSRGMASAFTAFAADGAAIWFNPAGLPLLEAKLLQGSLSLSSIQKTTFSDAIVSDDPNGTGPCDIDTGTNCTFTNFDLQSKPTLPGFAVASFALGKPKYDGKKTLQIAISAFQTYNTEVGGDIRVKDRLGRTNSLQFLQNDRITYIGAGLGWRAVKNFLVGISLFASNRTINHLETTSFAVGGTPDPSAGSPCPSSPTLPACINNARQANRNTRFSMNAWYLSTRIGFLQLLGDGRWRLGLMIQPPGIRVAGKSNLRLELSDVDARLDPAPSDSVFAQVERSSNSPIPWELRLGTAYTLTERINIAADLQLVGPVGSGSIAPGIPQLEGRANTSGALLRTQTKRDFTWNVSVGAEIAITHFLFTRFGFLTDRTGAPGIDPTVRDNIQVSGLDRYGFSASIGGHKNNKGLSVGFAGLFGKGIGPGLDLTEAALDGGQAAFFRTSQVKERVFIISIGGDVGQTASLVSEEIKEKKKDKKALTDEEEEKLHTPEMEAARKEAKEARLKADDAEKKLKEMEDQALGKDNLDKNDQEALQKSTVDSINTIR